jgi:hypothetical protein
MRTIICILLCCFIAVVQADDHSSAKDWRRGDVTKDKIDNLVKLVPGTSHWMVEMGARYQNLYWAAKQEKWEFALYQVEEMESLIKTVSRARPKRADTADQFMEVAFEPVERALVSQDWGRFEKAFQQLRSECISCHHKNDHGFIVIPVTPAWAPSPELNMAR